MKSPGNRVRLPLVLSFYANAEVRRGEKPQAFAALVEGRVSYQVTQRFPAQAG